MTEKLFTGTLNKNKKKKVVDFQMFVLFLNSSTNSVTYNFLHRLCTGHPISDELSNMDNVPKAFNFFSSLNSLKMCR